MFDFNFLIVDKVLIDFFSRRSAQQETYRRGRVDNTSIIEVERWTESWKLELKKMQRVKQKQKSVAKALHGQRFPLISLKGNLMFV